MATTSGTATERKSKLRRFTRAARRVSEVVASAATFEWFVLGNNGGGVVAARAFGISVWVFLLGLGVLNFTICEFGALTCDFHRATAAAQVRQLAPLFIATFAGAYTALHTRLSSQWRYLSGVYNQIKAAQCTGCRNEDSIADWKAGFIVDAKVLHLSNKPFFAATILQWSDEDEIVKSLLGDHPTEAQRKWVATILLGAERADLEYRKKRLGDFWPTLSDDEERELRDKVAARLQSLTQERES